MSREASSSQRRSVWVLVGDVVAVVLPLYVVWNYFTPLPPLQERAIFVVLVVALVFLRSAGSEGRNPWIQSLDILLLVGTIVSFGYVILNYGEITAAPTANPLNVTLGIIAIFVSIEATRRILSGTLAAIVLVVLMYGLFGEALPREYGGHGGFSINRIVTTTYLSTEGMFGIVTYTLFKFIFLFVMFGQLLMKLGALEFITTLARAALGRFRGGPALVAVMSSGLMGSLSGSATANVMVTGSVSIPLMKRLGFRPHVAGGVEAAASGGGQFLPPVMGAAAFLMAVVVGVPYLDVVRAATIPALAYFLAMLVAVYMYAVRQNVAKEEAHELPQLREAFRDLSGLVFLGGLGILITLLLMRFSPTRAALFSIGAMILIGLFHRNNRLNVKSALDVLKKTSDSFVSIGVAGPSVGIVVSVFLLSGIATRFASIIVGITDGNLVFLLILTMIACIILGVGLPTSVAYLILALTAAPALVTLGVEPLAAHMFIFFAGMMAMVTPPVGIASFAAATIAQTSFWKTGGMAVVLGLPAYLIPYAFVFDQGLLAIGSPGEIATAALSTGVGVSLMAAALVGPCLTWRAGAGRAIMFVAALLLITPEVASDVIGFVLGATVVLAAAFIRFRASRPQAPEVMPAEPTGERADEEVDDRPVAPQSVAGKGQRSPIEGQGE